MDDLFYGWLGVFGYSLLFCSWVNIAMIASVLGLKLLGRQREWIMLSGIIAMGLVLLIVQDTDLVFAGGLISSAIGLCAAGLFLSLMLERKDDPLYNMIRAGAFLVLLPASLMNLLVIGVRVFLLLAALWA